jgi:hypothetical protein
MQKRLFALAGLFLLFSCNDAAKNDGTATKEDNNDYMAKARRNTEHNREIYRAIETGDVSKLDSFVAKDVIDHEGNNGKDIVGLDSLKHHLGNLHNYFDGMKMEILSEGTSLDGAYHFSLIRMKGKTKANPWGMPVGMDIDDMAMDVVKIKDGKASEHWSFTSQKDINEMMAMSGGNKPPAIKESTNK